MRQICQRVSILGSSTPSHTTDQYLSIAEQDLGSTQPSVKSGHFETCRRQGDFGCADGVREMVQSAYLMRSHPGPVPYIHSPSILLVLL